MYCRKKTKLVCGVGINDANYTVMANRKDGYSFTCPVYKTWVSLLNRCFCPNEKERHPCYLDVLVCEDWLRFSRFKSWMDSQTYLDLAVKKLNLDKDLLILGNKEYSPEKCAFVPGRINTLLLTNGRSRGEQPIGVYYHTDMKSRPYRASINDNFDQRIRSSYYNTAEEAHTWWQEKKADVIREAVELWKVDPIHRNSYREDVAQAILLRADMIDRHRTERVETKYL